MCIILQIEQDFSLIHPGKPTLSECFPIFTDRILQVYKAVSAQPSPHIVPEENDQDFNGKHIQGVSYRGVVSHKIFKIHSFGEYVFGGLV